MHTNATFDKMEIHPGLFMIRDKKRMQVIGYVNMNPFEKYWFWFAGHLISENVFKTNTDAIDDMIRNYSISQMDKFAIKSNTFDNDELTLGR